MLYQARYPNKENHASSRAGNLAERHAQSLEVSDCLDTWVFSASAFQNFLMTYLLSANYSDCMQQRRLSIQFFLPVIEVQRDQKLIPELEMVNYNIGR